MEVGRHHGDPTTIANPRPHQIYYPHHQHQHHTTHHHQHQHHSNHITGPYEIEEGPDLTTPTRDSFRVGAGQHSSAMPSADISSGGGGGLGAAGTNADTSNVTTSYPPDAAGDVMRPPPPYQLPPRDAAAGLDRSASMRSARSGGSGGASTLGDDGDDAGGPDDDEDDDESPTGEDGKRVGGKKKGQRFWCTDFPPCNLSFTRSEHLARHIRKHTGERPFQCHCLRRFSRLDNLRQHAQTVHLNEDIPSDSLAATGTRFQRQVRTERVRVGVGRNRSSTIGSVTSPGYHRGHSRNFSGSSIGSMASMASDVGSPGDEMRGRPSFFQQHQQQQQQQQAMHPHHQHQHHHPQHPAMHMGGRHHGGMTLDPYGQGVSGGPHQDQTNYPYYFPQGSHNHGYSPQSQLYPAEANSPGAHHAGLQSPIAMAHNHGGGVTAAAAGWAEPAHHARRMSVPSNSALFGGGGPAGGAGMMGGGMGGGGGGPSSYGSSAAAAATSSSYMSSTLGSSSNTSSYSNASSMVASPTASSFADSHHQDLPTEAELRRRTWHPGTYGAYGPRPATSGLSYYQTPDAPKPVAHAHPAAAQQAQTPGGVRLPSISSFLDRGATVKPAAPAHQHAAPPPQFPRPPSPMEVDQTPCPPPRSLDRPSHGQSVTFDQHAAPPPSAPRRSLHAATHSAPQSLQTAAREMQAAGLGGTAAQPTATHSPPVTPRRQKREGWYNGPFPASRDAYPYSQAPVLRASPGGSSAGDAPVTPSTLDAYPTAAASVVHSGGYVERVPYTPTSTHTPTTNADAITAIHSSRGDEQPSKMSDGVAVDSYSMPSVAAPAPPPVQGYYAQRRNGDMDRLDALVAVATSESESGARM